MAWFQSLTGIPNHLDYCHLLRKGRDNVSIPHGHPQPFNAIDLVDVDTGEALVSIPHGHPQPFRLKDESLVRLELCRFQSLTGIANHLDECILRCMQNTSRIVSIPHGHRQPFRRGHWLN